MICAGCLALIGPEDSLCRVCLAEFMDMPMSWEDEETTSGQGAADASAEL